MTSFRALSAAFAACVCVAGVGLTGCTGAFDHNLSHDTSAAKPVAVETVALPPRAEPAAMVQAQEPSSSGPSAAYIAGMSELMALVDSGAIVSSQVSLNGQGGDALHMTLRDDLPADSPLSQLGLKAGDRLTAINGNAVANLQELKTVAVKLRDAGQKSLEVTFARARGGSITTPLPMCCQ